FALDGVPTCEIDLNDLSAEDVTRCAEAELGGRLSADLEALFLEKTRGNPFFVQQLTRYFVENAAIIRHADGQWRLVAAPQTLPDTINAVLMARIDRLAEQVKEMVKVAAVIGREFDVSLLSAVLHRDVSAQIKIVEEAQIWEPLQELRYMFKHALLRDTAYAMQLRARLRELHRLTAEAIETLYAAHPAEKYAELAFHYEKAAVSAKAREYLAKAGDEA
ncbi:MAG: adenylate/guanylate cyclase domain-containing protein, partial [Gammaproteobacteria bacterium]|nr:adenylate/guanylate cyclase domain-containing protein [Gammaproteobacteria bacterium]